MKRCVWMIVTAMSLTFSFRALAQSEEAQQLLLNVQKLAQLKQMLADLKKGYEIVFRGYTTIKNISEDGFNLHQAFLDGLLQVSPAVRNYKKVADILSFQIKLVQEYKSAYRRFKESDRFTPEEIDYLGKVYANLFDQSLKNIEALSTVLTAGKLRMSDDERLDAIDTLFRDMQEKLTFLRQFNTRASILALQRTREQNNVRTTRKLYGLKN